MDSDDGGISLDEAVGLVMIEPDDSVHLVDPQSMKMKVDLDPEEICTSTNDLPLALHQLTHDVQASDGTVIHAIHQDLDGTNLAAAEDHCGQQYIINTSDLSEGMVGVDPSILGQTFVPVVLDLDNQDLAGMCLTAQIVENAALGGQKMIILTPSNAISSALQQVNMVESQSDVAFETPEGETEDFVEEIEEVTEEFEEPSAKRIKIESSDDAAPMLLLTMSENGEEVMETTEEVVSNAKVTTTTYNKCSMLKTAGLTTRVGGSTDVSQAWFTTKDDKVALQNKGHQWKQGQWTKDEVELLEHNIAQYCVDHQIEDPADVIFQFSKEERKDFYRTVAKGLQRPLFSVYRRVIRMYDQKNHIGKYTPEEIIRLKELRAKHGTDWATIGTALGRSSSSVKDRCRLMKETCNSGKWLPDEERLLAQAVYELSGCEPGDSVTRGLSWAAVAERVISRSEKQCRTKWLNYLNWKQVGGTEWTRDDDIMLINKLIMTNATDETQVDWGNLSENWPSARSPQWLRGKWWTLKRHSVPDYQNLPLQDLLEILKEVHYPKTQVKSASHVTQIRKLGLQQLGVLPNMTLTIPMGAGTDVVSSTTHGSSLCEEGEVSSTQGLEVYPDYSMVTSQPQGAYIITQPNNTSAITLTGTNMATDHIIVHTLPINQENIIHTPDALTNGVPVQLNAQQAQVILSAEDNQHCVGSIATDEAIAAMQLQAIGQSDNDLQPLSQSDEITASSVSEISQSDLGMQEHISSQGEMMSAPSDNFESQITGSDMTSDVTQSGLDGHVSISASALDGHVSISAVSSGSPQFVQSTSDDLIQNMSSFSDPMLTSEGNDLIGSSSDVEGDKTQCGADTAAE